MNEAILRLKEKKNGEMNKATFYDIHAAAKTVKDMPSIRREGHSISELEQGVKNAIEKGHEFPKDSGYTWDYLLTSNNVGEC